MDSLPPSIHPLAGFYSFFAFCILSTSRIHSISPFDLSQRQQFLILIKISPHSSLQHKIFSSSLSLLLPSLSASFLFLSQHLTCLIRALRLFPFTLKPYQKNSIIFMNLRNMLKYYVILGKEKEKERISEAVGVYRERKKEKKEGEEKER